MSRYSLGKVVFNEDIVESLVQDTHTFRKISIDSDAEGVVDYGFDNACGYFVQLWSDIEEENFDIDSMFYGLSGAELAHFLKLFHGNEDHITMCALDLPF